MTVEEARENASRMHGYVLGALAHFRRARTAFQLDTNTYEAYRSRAEVLALAYDELQTANSEYLEALKHDTQP